MKSAVLCGVVLALAIRGGPPLFADYQDRYVMITREKLTSLQSVGASVTLPITYTEPMTLITKGSSTMYLRIERIQ